MNTDFHLIFVILYPIIGVAWGWFFSVLSDHTKTNTGAIITLSIVTFLVYFVTLTVSRNYWWGLIFGIILIPTNLVVLLGNVRWLHSFGSGKGYITPLERIHYSFSSIDPIWIIRTSIMVGFTVIPMGVILYYPFDATYSFTSISLAIIVGMCDVFVLLGLNDGLSADELSYRSFPNEGMYASARNALVFSTLTFIATISFFTLGTVIMGIKFHTAFFVSTALALSVLAQDSLSHGGLPVFKHIILRFQLERQQLIPRNMARFYDYAASLIFLRKVGGGYIFIHRYLLEYFAELETPESNQG